MIILPRRFLHCAALFLAIGSCTDKPAAQQPSPTKSNSPLVQAITFDQKGEYVAACWPGTIQVWQVSTGRLVSRIALNAHTLTEDLAFSPDRKSLAGVGQIGGVRLWEFPSGQPLGIFAEDKLGIHVLAYSPDSNLIATANIDGAIQIWEVASGKMVRSLSGHTDQVTDLAFSPNGRWLASSSWDKTVAIWDLSTGKSIASLKGHVQWVNSLVFSPDSERVVSVGTDGLINVWEISTGANLLSFSNLSYGIAMPVEGVAFSYDGQRIITISIGQGTVWDIKTGRKVFELDHLPAGSKSVALGNNGQEILIASTDGRVLTFALKTGERTREFKVAPNDKSTK